MERYCEEGHSIVKNVNASVEVAFNREIWTDSLVAAQVFHGPLSRRGRRYFSVLACKPFSDIKKVMLYTCIWAVTYLNHQTHI